MGIKGICCHSGNRVERGLEEAGLGGDRRALGHLRVAQARGRRDESLGCSDDRPPAFLGWKQGSRGMPGFFLEPLSAVEEDMSGGP